MGYLNYVFNIKNKNQITLFCSKIEIDERN